MYGYIIKVLNMSIWLRPYYFFFIQKNEEMLIIPFFFAIFAEKFLL